jgi:hypothetical protein
MKRTIAIIVAVFALAVSAQAQASLTASSSIPVADGTMGASEYQFNTNVSGMTIGATLGSDGMVYLSIQANTAGWVALGVGGLVMNGSRLFIAFDTGTKQSFYEQLGAGHSHGDPQDLVVSKWAVKKTDGTTTLELALPAAAALTDGKLDLLFAYSDTTAYAHHKARGSLSLAIQG